MKKIPKASYKTPQELEERIRDRELEAALLPPGNARQSVLIEIAQLRAYADVKRWIETPAAGKAKGAPGQQAQAAADKSASRERST